MDHHAALTKYLAGERVDIAKVMRSLPANVDVALAAGVVEKLMERDFWLGRMCKSIPPPVIRAVLAKTNARASLLFLRMAVPTDVDDAALVRAWQRALVALLDLDTTYGWGSKQRKAKIVGLARDAHVLQAIQATVAHSDAVKLDMLAVLVADGTDTSYDALVKHIDSAFASGDGRLDMLARLRTHTTSTPALDRLFAELDGALQARNDASPALRLGPIIGIGDVDLLWFGVRLGSTKNNRNGVPWVQGQIDVDSRDPRWFRVWISTVEPDGDGKSTTFTDAEAWRDDLKLGRCTPEQFPAWLAAAAAALAIEWSDFSPRSNLRGAKRDRIVKWLLSARARA